MSAPQDTDGAVASTPRLSVEVGVLLVLAALPLLSLVGQPGALLADPSSEFPIKLWSFETFPSVGLFGGRVEGSAFPHPGPLNNPDVVGTIVTGLLRPLVGRVWAYNLFVVLQLQATALATWALARDICADRRAALVAGVGFALTPLVLLYCLTGAVTDMLTLWPYPLAIRAFLRGGLRNGALAGVWAVVGMAACPYNFLVFGAMALPAVLFVPLWGRGVGHGSLVATGLGCALAAAPLGGAYAYELHALTADPDAQVSTASIALTRNVAPYPYLAPGHTDRYTSYLADFVAVGKSALIQRSAGSRYFRAYSPGMLLLLLGALGLAVAPRRAGLFAAMAVWSAIASTGPFLPLNGVWALSTPGNPVWLGLDRWLPGADLLLEPFRYALGAVLGLSVCAAIGLAWVSRRWGGWTVGAAVTVVLAEIAFVSPVPLPLLVADATVPPLYSRLDRLPAGALVELPFFDRGTDVFNRVHFLHQLVHHRPIVDEVVGLPPRAFAENQFLAALVNAEKPQGRLHVDVTDPSRIAQDRAALRAQGYAGLVVDLAGYRSPVERDRVLALIAGMPELTREDGRVVVRAP